MAAPSWQTTPFEEWTLKEATDFIGTLKDEDGDKNRRLYAGDGWLDGDGWKPGLPTGDGAAEKIAAIRKIFVHEPLIAEAVDNHRDGVIAREPLWRYVLARTVRSARRIAPRPTTVRAMPALTPPQPDPATSAPPPVDTPVEDQQDARITELEEAQTDKWDERDTLAILQDATVTSELYGRAPLRLYVPAGLRSEQGTIAADSLESALRLLYLDNPDPAQAGVCTHDDTKRQCGVFVYTDAAGNTFAELSYLDPATGNTVLRVVGKGGIEGVPWAANLGGRLLLHELRGNPLIGQSERDNQISGNFAKTLMGRQLELGGYRERNYLNVQPPGYWENEAGQPWTGKPGERRVRFVATTLPTGPSVDRYLQGAEMVSAQGEFKGFANPSLAYEDPVSLAEPERGLANARRSILAATGQLYLAMTGDGAASGVSRIQARAVHEARLGKRKAMLDAGIRWYLEAESRFAGSVIGRDYNDLRAEANAIIDTGPILPDEQTALLNIWQAGGIAHETFLAKLGTDDPDAELERIRKEKDEQTAREDASFTRLTQPTATPPGAGTSGAVDPAAQLAAELGQAARAATGG